MAEFTRTVAATDQIFETTVSHNRKRASTRSKLLSLATAGLVLAGCGTAEPTISAKNTPTTTSVEAKPTSAAPTTTETTPTPTETTESTSATAEVDAQKTLCDKAEVLGITRRLGKASCTVVKTDKYFTGVIDGAHWRSDAGDVTVKVIRDPSGVQFGTPATYHGVNIQSDERNKYGLQDYNPICSETACYTLQKDNQVYGDDVVYEVATGSRDQDLNLLSQLVNGDN